MLITECLCVFLAFVFFFKQKTAYDMRISDWSSDVCSSDLAARLAGGGGADFRDLPAPHAAAAQIAAVHRLPGGRVSDPAVGVTITVAVEIGRASCRARVCQYV